MVRKGSRFTMITWIVALHLVCTLVAAEETGVLIQQRAIAESRMATVEGQVASLGADVIAVKSDISTIKSQISAFEAKLNYFNYEIGEVRSEAIFSELNENYETYLDKDCQPGSHIDSHRFTRRGCIEICSMINTCQGVVFKPSTRECWRKANCNSNNLVDNVGVETHIKKYDKKYICLSHSNNPLGARYRYSDLGYAGNGPITKIHVRMAGNSGCVGFTYGKVTAPCYGSGQPTTVDLSNNEKIVEVNGKTSASHGWIEQITFVTNQRTLGPYGTSNSQQTFRGTGAELAYISGWSGSQVDLVTFHFYCF